MDCTPGTLRFQPVCAWRRFCRLPRTGIIFRFWLLGRVRFRLGEIDRSAGAERGPVRAVGGHEPLVVPAERQDFDVEFCAGVCRLDDRRASVFIHEGQDVILRAGRFAPGECLLPGFAEGAAIGGSLGLGTCAASAVRRFCRRFSGRLGGSLGRFFGRRFGSRG